MLVVFLGLYLSVAFSYVVVVVVVVFGRPSVHEQDEGAHYTKAVKQYNQPNTCS